MSLEAYKAAKARLDLLQAGASGSVDIQALPVGAGMIQVIAQGADAEQTAALAEAIAAMDASIFVQAIAATQAQIDAAKPAALAELQGVIASIEGA